MCPLAHISQGNSIKLCEDTFTYMAVVAQHVVVLAKRGWNQLIYLTDCSYFGPGHRRLV